MGQLDKIQENILPQARRDDQSTILESSVTVSANATSIEKHHSHRAEDFRFSRLFGKGFELLFKRFFFFFPVSLLLLLPFLVSGVYLPVLTSGFGGPQTNWPNMLINQVIVVLCTSVMSAVLMYAIIKELQGERVGASLALRRGLRASVRASVTAVLVSMITIVGFMMLIVPSWIWGSMLWVAVPATVVERIGPTASLSRSAELTKGYRWTIFGVLVFLGVANLIIFQILGAVIGSSIRSVNEMLLHLHIYTYFLQAFEAALLACMASYGYYLLVSSREGTNIDKIAAVFD
jgi:hypothetical protein